MELEKKRKREDGGEVNGKRGKAAGDEENDDGVKGLTVPADEEVEEFFAILKRIQVAVKYFKKRDGGRRDPAATAWSPTFEREDFDGVINDGAKCPEKKQDHENAGLDLNSDPFSDVSSDSTTES